MKIVDVKVRVFKHKTRRVSDSAGHSHPGPEHDAKQALLSIVSGRRHRGTLLLAAGAGAAAYRREIFQGRASRPGPVRPGAFVAGTRPLAARQPGAAFGSLDQHCRSARLWDLAGRALNLPVYKLLGAYRDEIPAYASTMCGDELKGGLATPEDYGRFAEQLMEEGYKAIKLHTWMPPVSWAPSVTMDVKACAAVRDAVGPDVPLMLDAYHWYSRLEALKLGRELEKLDFYWLEECHGRAEQRFLQMARGPARHPDHRTGNGSGQILHPRRMGDEGPATSCASACRTSAASGQR